MNSTPNPVNGQAKTSAAGRPRLKLRIGSGKATSFEADSLNAADWEDFRQQCEQAGKRVTIRVDDLPRWPDDSRYQLLSLVRQLGTRCRLYIRGTQFDSAFEGVLSAFAHGLTLDEQQNMHRAAIEAAALFYPDLAEETARQINSRLGEVGAARINHNRLVKQIRGAAGLPTAAGNGASDAHSVAVQFIGQLRADADLGDGQPVLRYYQDGFYLWQVNVWRLQADQQFQAAVMRFLQGLDLPHLTERFCRDVIAHLKALSLLDCWQESPPFEVVSEHPLQYRRVQRVVFANGGIDIDAATDTDEPPELLEVGPEYFNEVVLPYEFDPEAKCPLWLQTLKDILPKTGNTDRRRRVLQEYMGYSLLQDCHFQKFLVLLGDGGNGKSTVTETWEALLGEDNVSTVRLDELGQRFRAWALRGKLANFSGELPYLGQINESQLKRLVSGEPVDVDRKNRDPVKLRSFAKLIVNTNDLPQIRDPTPATWDRMIVMPFDVRVRGTHAEDKDRVQKLRSELPGIFLWSLKGLRRLLHNSRFTNCAKCAAATRSHRIESDSVLQFAGECCKAAESWRLYSTKLYELYRAWAEATGRKPVQDAEFGRRLKRAGWVKKRQTSGNRAYEYVGRKLSLAAQDYVSKARLQLTDITYHTP